VLKKGLFGLVLLSLVGTARLHNADFASALGGLPIVGPLVQPTPAPPAYIEAIGTPAAVTLPEADYAAWFPAEAPVDPYAVAVWKQVDAFVPVAGTKAGWAEACKAVGAVAGSDRTANPRLAALACSSDPTVTQMQQFALHVLGAQASVALWIKGEPNGSVGAIQGRQAELRVFCSAEVIARQGPDSPWTEACDRALDAAYLAGDGPATFEALGEAYLAAAAEIARLDPEVDTEPGYFGAATAP
jgi:hypothetical protein